MAGLDIGARRVQVVVDDHVPLERWVVIRDGETTTLAVTQVREPVEPIYKAWWFWTLVGIAAAGGATGAVFALRSGDSPGSPNPTGVNVAVNANQAFGGSP